MANPRATGRNRGFFGNGAGPLAPRLGGLYGWNCAGAMLGTISVAVVRDDLNIGYLDSQCVVAPATQMVPVVCADSVVKRDVPTR